MLACLVAGAMALRLSDVTTSRRAVVLAAGSAALPVWPAFAELKLSISPTQATIRVLAAEQSVTTLLDSENLSTLRVMLGLGLPTFEGKYAPPGSVPFEYFQRLQLEVPEAKQGAFMDAAVSFEEYLRDARDLLELARLARTNGAGPEAAQSYLDRAIPDLKGCAKELKTIVPLLPRV